MSLEVNYSVGPLSMRKNNSQINIHLVKKKPLYAIYVCAVMCLTEDPRLFDISWLLEQSLLSSLSQYLKLKI